MDDGLFGGEKRGRNWHVRRHQNRLLIIWIFEEEMDRKTIQNMYKYLL
jgi:hypothetical protein